MNLTKAICDHGPQALAEIDSRISGILRELTDLQTKRLNILLHLNIEESMGSLSPMVVLETALEDDV